MTDDGRPTIRTMKTDVDELLTKEPESILKSITDGPRERYERGYAPPHGQKNYLRIILGILLMFGITGAGIGIYSLFAPKPIPPKLPLAIPRSFIPTDSTHELKITAGDRTGLIGALQDLRTSPNKSFAHIPFIVAEFTKDPHVGTIQEFFGTLRITLHPDVEKSLTGKWNILSSKGGIILVFEIKDEQKALGGMLRWEEKFVLDLTPVTGVAPEGTIEFHDIVIKNNIARVVTLSETEDRSIGYAILPQGFLLITTSEASLRESIDRFIAGPITN